MKRYLAMIWTDDVTPGERVSVDGEDLSAAKQKLEQEYGEGTVFNLHNEDDAKRPRAF